MTDQSEKTTTLLYSPTAATKHGTYNAQVTEPDGKKKDIVFTTTGTLEEYGFKDAVVRWQGKEADAKFLGRRSPGTNALKGFDKQTF